MIRLGALAAGAFLGLMAGCAGAAFYYYFGMTAAQSATIALAAFVALAAVHSISTRLRDRFEVGMQIADLSRGTADLGRQVLELERRMAALEAKADKAFAEAAEAGRPLAAEVERMRAAIDRIAPAIAAAATVSSAPAAALARVESDHLAAGLASAGAGSFAGLEPDAIVAQIREAIAANRVALYLQPIVSLPQRKVRYYEAMAGLRTDRGDLVPPAALLPLVEAAGLTAQIDHAMLLRGVQASRRLSIKNRDAGLFCRVAAATLVDPAVFPRFLEFAEANRAIAPGFVFAVSHAAYRAMGSKEAEGLGALAAHGFRFLLDGVGDLRLEARDLADRGFRFIKAPASLLLNRSAALAANIDPSELVAYLNGFGIDLIAEQIERESVVVDLLDYEVKLGQGALFSPPRPARADAPKETEQHATHETPVAPNAPESVSPPAVGGPSAAESPRPPTAIGEPTAAAAGRGRRRPARARRAPDMPARN